MVGRTISHYRIVSQLGAGGMGVVYRAEDTRLGRSVALKFVSEDFSGDEQAIQRLRSEARAASALNHANICTIYDVGEEDGHPYIVMELMKGESLRDRIARGPLQVHQLLDIGIDIAGALQSAHSDGIIHRDIKPGNIFLTERGQVKLLDFGLAKLTPNFTGASTTMAADPTVAGVTLGTVSYMSPEQATGEELDGRTDVFSLGVVLYECATGRHPFSGKTSAVTLSAILTKPALAPLAIKPDLPVRLQEVITNALEKERDLRYQTAADLRADLKRLRRDLESGHSRAVELQSAISGAPTGDGTAASSRAASAMTEPSVMVPAKPARAPLLLLAVLGVAGLVAAGLYISSRQESATIAPAASAPPAVAVDNRLSLAQAALAAGNHRAAAAYAAEVLAMAPAHSDALRIRDESNAILARFDSAIAEARQLLSRGDVSGAAQALDRARRLEPTEPAVVELASQLAQEIREREARAAERSAVRDGARQPPVRVEPPRVPAAPSAESTPARPPAASPLPPTPAVTNPAGTTPAAPPAAPTRRRCPLLSCRNPRRRHRPLLRRRPAAGDHRAAGAAAAGGTGRRGDSAACGHLCTRDRSEGRCAVSLDQAESVARGRAPPARWFSGGRLAACRSHDRLDRSPRRRSVDDRATARHHSVRRTVADGGKPADAATGPFQRRLGNCGYSVDQARRSRAVR